MSRGRRRRAATASLILCLVAITALIGPVQVAGASDGKRLDETRRKLRETRTRISTLRQMDSQLLAVIADTAGQLGVAQTRLQTARGRLAAVEARVKGAERRLADLEDQRRVRAQRVAARAGPLYITGAGAPLDAILGASSLEEFVSRTSFLELSMRNERKELEDLARIRHDIQQVRSQLLAERERAVSVRDEIAAHAALVSDVLATRRAAEAALSQRIVEFQAEARALEQEQARILAIIRARQSRSTGPVSRRGFIWPFRGPVTSDYGPRWGGFHTGIDIDCTTGDPIKATKAGRVIAAEWGGGYGWMVIIDHGNGVSTLYAHNDRLDVSDGESVTRGERIASCGNTGNSHGDHVHFEVRVDGDPRDPRPFLP